MSPYRKTILQPGEVMREIVLPRGGPAAGLTRRVDFLKVSKRRELDISIVAAAFRVDLDASGIVRVARLAFGGVAAMPSRALAVEAALVGKKLTEPPRRPRFSSTPSSRSRMRAVARNTGGG